MKKTTLFTFILFLGVAALAFSQALTIDYLDGTVELKTARGWSGLSIGDQVAADATIRIARGGVIELSTGTQRLSIVKEGTYVLSTLIKASDTAATRGLGAQIAQKLRSLTTEQQATGTTGGVRAGEVGTRETMEYVDEYTEYRDKVRKYFASGDYAGAIPTLQSAVAESIGSDEQAEFSYQLAVAYYETARTAQAYRVISKISPSTSTDYYPDFIILKAQVLVDSLAYQDALSVLTPFLASKPGTGYAQLAYLLTAQASRGMGDEKAAKDALAKGFALDPASETAAQIAKLQR
jgi:tetratricopeptide (TPR) repeat protein